MKKLLFFMLLLMFWLPKTQAQEYHQMLGDTVVWYETNIFEFTGTTIYTTMGDDTMVNNLLYRKIVQTVPYSNDYTFPYILLREDTETKKIYAKPYYTMYVDSEAVIYDFNLMPNDSFFVNGVDNSSICPIAWYHVDSVRLFNTLIDSRKVIYLSSNINGGEYKPVWVEGIGCLAGLTLNSIEVSYDFINCYIRNDTLIYESDYAIYFNECYLWVGVNDKNNLIEYEISPNPFNDKISINKSNNNYIIIELYDIYGKLLKKEIAQDNRTILYLSDLFSGLYIIRIIDTNRNIYTKKIIKN